MRVLITANAGYGHLAPLIPFAAAIRAAGHDVAFATSERCREGLAAHGLALEPCGPAWQESDFGRAPQPRPALDDLTKHFETVIVPRVLADLAAAVARSRPDIILSNDFEPCGRLVAERTGIPFVLASSGPRLDRTQRRLRHSGVLASARRVAGLAEGRELDYSLQWLHLNFAPCDWVFRGSLNARPALHVEAENEFGIRPSVTDLGVSRPYVVPGARPAALCTFGTVFNKRPELLRTVIAGVARCVPRTIAVLGPGGNARDLGPLPPGVEVHAQMPVTAALPHADYVVTHGGAATLTALQLQGIPSLLFPQGGDQPINAAASRTRGISVVRFHTVAAVVVGAYPNEPMTADSVERAFRELMADPGFRQRARDFRASLEALPPLEHAVRSLERLAATRAPVLRAHVPREPLEPPAHFSQRAP